MKKLSSKVLYEFYKELEAHDIENHGLLIMQGQDVMFEEYSYPYSGEMPHTLFSVTKSLVSTAVGFAIDEGKLSLDDKVLSFFPNYKRPESDEWNNLTVRSLLTMSSNKEFTFLQDMTKDYTELFMNAPFRKKGKGFLYSNNDAHMLSAIVQKATGENVEYYLTKRLFTPLGIPRPFWERNDKGECIGGTGAYLRLKDLAKICRCYADGGKYKNQQIIPEFWTREATKMQVSFGGNRGYGYLFWIEGDMFSMTGMYGQIISYVPKYDAVIAIMNCCIDEGANERLLKEVLVNAFEDESGEEWDEKLADYLSARGEKIVPCENIPNIPVGKEFFMTTPTQLKVAFPFPASIIPRTVTCSLARRPKKSFDRVSFSLSDDVFTVKWYEEADEVVIDFGLKGEPKLSHCSIKGYPYTLWAYAYSEGGILKGVVRILNTLATQYISFSFSENKIGISMRGTPDTKLFIKKHTNGVDFIRNHRKLCSPITSGLDYMLDALEKEMVFKVK